MPNKVCHFEIPGNDPEKLAEFYGKIFDWEIEKMPGDMDYWLIKAEGVGGGIFKRPMPEAKHINYISVDCIDEWSKKIEEAGGKIVAPKAPVPGMGWFAVALDPQNNPFGIWKNDENASME